MDNNSLLRGRFFRLGIGILISGICLYLALKNVDFRTTWTSVSQADLRWLAIALLFVLVNNLAKAARWKVLLGARGEQIDFGKALVSHLAGQTLNSLFPARLGDLSRAYTVGAMGPGHAYVLGTVMLEKLPDIIALAVLFLVLLALIPLPDWVGGSGYALVIIAILTSVVVLLAIFRRETLMRGLQRGVRLLPLSWQGGVSNGLSAGFSSLDVFYSRSQILKLVAWTGLIWTTALGVNYIVFRALALDAPFTAALLLLLVLTVGIVVPSVPGRVGVFEYMCILCLSIFGIGQSEGLGYGILLHAIIFLPVAFFGLLFMSFLEGSKAIVDDPTGMISKSKGDPS